jgi:hypothetical protein
MKDEIQKHIESLKNYHNLEKYSQIMEWVYVNDGSFGSKQEWREAFDMMLHDVILEDMYEDDDHACECSNCTNCACRQS